MAPVPMVADAARAVVGPDDPAATMRVVVIRVIIVIRPIEVPVKVAVPEPAMAKAAAVKNMRGSEAAAVKRRAATMEASTVETAATMAASATAASAMPAASLDGQPVRGEFRGGRHARIDQRKRLCALASYGRQRKHRGSRNAQATEKTALGIWNLHHL